MPNTAEEVAEMTFWPIKTKSSTCGTPGIVYDKTASPELITPETGIVLKDVGDFNTIIDSIEFIREKGKAHYSTACRERAAKFYNKDDKFKEYITLYNPLIE